MRLADWPHKGLKPSSASEAHLTRRPAADLGRADRLDQLTALRGPGESYSDVILRLAALGPESLNRS